MNLDIELDPAQRLIVKAALRGADDAKDQRWKGMVGRIRQEAYADVACDVLRLCSTPHAFAMAMREGLAEHPVPMLFTATRERAQATRSEWAHKLSDAVLARLI